ncbi:MAG TPA: glycoside hydrolase family 3 N-terminal domain-containing protein [Cyclobacteriaceae bacterium]|nr:glycoside hydrolase family 3 N-terminal domain-containing protein [Cyclobacteriaceae bacterium]
MRYLFCLSLLILIFPSLAQKTDSLDIKIGQMIMIGYPGTEVDAKVLDEVQKGKVGSILLFEKNIPKTNSFIALKKILWTYQHAAPMPLFIAVDQEGGKVNRLKDKYGFPRSITAKEMGSAGTLDSVRFYGEATAATLFGLGFNVNFAPVVDLASNPSNPVIVKNGRSFSADEDTVILMAREFIQTHRKLGVITVLKHFPGHGSSQADTHFGIADVTNTWDDRELEPYRELIESGDVDAIMSAHIVNRKLDPAGNPGTLSSNILTGVLRKELDYHGVVFSDDMQMQAITKHYGLEEAIRLAILAGIDIMTFSNNITGSEERTVDRVHQVIKDYVMRGVITRERIDQSYERIMQLKRKLAPNSTEEYYARELLYEQRKVEELNAQLKAIKEENAKLLASKKKKKRRKQK